MVLTEKQKIYATEFFDRSKRKDLDQTALELAAEVFTEEVKQNGGPPFNGALMDAIRMYMAVIAAKAIPEDA